MGLNVLVFLNVEPKFYRQLCAMSDFAFYRDLLIKMVTTSLNIADLLQREIKGRKEKRVTCVDASIVLEMVVIFLHF